MGTPLILVPDLCHVGVFFGILPYILVYLGKAARGLIDNGLAYVVRVCEKGLNHRVEVAL